MISKELFKHPIVIIPTYSLLAYVGYLFLFEFVFTGYNYAFLSVLIFQFYLIALSLLSSYFIAPIKWNFNIKNASYWFALAMLSMLILTIFNLAFGGKIKYISLNINILDYSLIFLILQSIVEEIVFRGVIFNVTKTKSNLLVATLVSSIAFALVHIFNPAINVIPLVNIVLAGVLFAFIYYKTNSIVNSIAFHIAWNFTQGNILGVSVSGIESSNSVFVTTLANSDILYYIIGNQFGYESGLLCTIIMLVLIFIAKPLKTKDIQE